MAAEQEARNKKRKAEGLPPLEDSSPYASAPLDEETSKRRRLLQEALELDKDEDEDEDADEKEGGKDNDGCAASPMSSPSLIFLRSNDEESEDESEDDTAELLRELEKIKRERAEEKARLEQDQSAKASASKQSEIAMGNPLLNLAAALGQAPGVNTTVPGTFQVKKRWDDGTLNPLLSDFTSRLCWLQI